MPCPYGFGSELHQKAVPLPRPRAGDLSSVSEDATLLHYVLTFLRKNVKFTKKEVWLNPGSLASITPIVWVR